MELKQYIAIRQEKSGAKIVLVTVRLDANEKLTRSTETLARGITSEGDAEAFAVAAAAMRDNVAVQYAPPQLAIPLEQSVVDSGLAPSDGWTAEDILEREG